MTSFTYRINGIGRGWNRLTGRAQLIITALFILLVGWLFFHGGDDKNKDRKPQAPIAIAPVVRKDVPVYLDGLGSVQAYNTVTVHTQVDGQLISVAFKEGQDVHKGDVLAQIDPRTYKAQYDQAVANKAKDAALLENAKRDLERYVNLGNSISGQTLDTQRATVHQQEAAVNSDQAAVDNAATLLSYTTIASPINGRTGIRQVDAGNIVHASDANGLVVITQLQPISVIFSLPQQNLQAIAAQSAGPDKLPVAAMVANNPTPLDNGVLELVDNQIDPTTGTIKLKATFPNDKHQLWPGGFVNVQLLLDTRKDAVVVPTVSVQRGPNGVAYVFVYKADDKTVEMRNVKVSLTEGQDTVVDDGVQENEQVVIDGMGKLQNGSHVTLASDKKDDAKAGAADGSKEKKHGHKKDKQEQ